MTADPGERVIEYVPLDEVIGADRNPKGHYAAGIKTSIQTFGFTTPAVLDERTGKLVIGHGRLEALTDLQAQDEPRPDGVGITLDGRWTIPLVRGWASRDDAHADAMLVADNKLTESGGWDDRELAELLEDVADYSVDLLLATGFDQDDLERLIADATGQGLPGGTGEDEDPDTAEGEEERERQARSDGSLLALADASVDEPRHEVHAGDVWLLGRLPHTLVVNEVHTQWDKWVRLLRPDMLLVPYAGPYTALTERAENTPLLMVQPDPYLAGHVLDKYTAVHGDRTVRRAK
jgi:ParB-like chromosome segregation protein Spo0J